MKIKTLTSLAVAAVLAAAPALSAVAKDSKTAQPSETTSASAKGNTSEQSAVTASASSKDNKKAQPAAATPAPSPATVVMYDKVLNTDSQPEDIIVPEGLAEYASDGLRITKPGDFVKLDRYYSLADRTARYNVRLSEDAVALFQCDSKDFVAYVDMTTKNVGIRIRSGRDQFTPRDTQAAFPNPSHDYIVEIKRYYNTMTVTLMDAYTGEEVNVSVASDGSGGAGSGSVHRGVRVGLLHDYYTFGLESGSEMLVKQLSVLAGQCDYTLLLYGDSITEPESYYPAEMLDQAWPQLIMGNVKGKSATSGRSATQIKEIIERIKNELPYVKAKYVMVTIGTNGGNTEENLCELVEYILSQGSIPVLNNIPSNESNSQVETNAMIEKVRQKYGIKGCRFDLPTSLAKDGKEVDTSTMWTEFYGPRSYFHHPNALGSRLMYLQTLLDVPEIYE